MRHHSPGRARHSVLQFSTGLRRRGQCRSPTSPAVLAYGVAGRADFPSCRPSRRAGLRCRGSCWSCIVAAGANRADVAAVSALRRRGRAALRCCGSCRSCVVAAGVGRAGLPALRVVLVMRVVGGVAMPLVPASGLPAFARPCRSSLVCSLRRTVHRCSFSLSLHSRSSSLVGLPAGFLSFDCSSVLRQSRACVRRPASVDPPLAWAGSPSSCRMSGSLPTHLARRLSELFCCLKSSLRSAAGAWGARHGSRRPRGSPRHQHGDRPSHVGLWSASEFGNRRSRLEVGMTGSLGVALDHRW